ncbi:histidine phosphatase family protein [Actinomadura soli]|uniref:Histidine phosphatase family protein n=1 Tax=Actinomadura soli TaxID=2508997 RepID=A0A5C4JBW0_9ACTN|nr:histidine phosphatase family protein [Actinomadura soli]TMR00771.1 histidine phosphatase family protein [Actinomadura soli]
MTVRLVLISHASTAATREARFPADEPLDTRGLAAATACHGALGRVDAAHRGPERRCEQTAVALGLDAAPDPLLADLDAAAWRGRRLADVEAENLADLYAWMTDPGRAPHGGETAADVIARMGAWLDRLPDTPSRIAAVTHPAQVRAAVLHVLGCPPGGFWRMDVPPLSQTVLSRRGGRWRLRETGHQVVVIRKSQ